MVADKGVEVRVGLCCITRLDFVAAVVVKGGLGENLARQPDASPEINPILRVGHIVELYARIGFGSADRSVTCPRDADRIGPTWA